MEKTQQLELLKAIRPHLNTSNVIATNAVYISPAESLRRQADEIEHKESLAIQLDQLISDLEEFLASFKELKKINPDLTIMDSKGKF